MSLEIFKGNTFYNLFSVKQEFVYTVGALTELHHFLPVDVEIKDEHQECLVMLFRILHCFQLHQTLDNS